MSSISKKPVCGAHIFTTYWLYKWFRITDPMQPACHVHDESYDSHMETEGGIADTSRWIDWKFWEDMGILIRQQKNLWVRALMHIQRPVYYGLVRVYGSILWSKKAGD